MAFKKGTRFLADWRTAEGQRLRKSFKTRKAARTWQKLMQAKAARRKKALAGPTSRRSSPAKS